MQSQEIKGNLARLLATENLIVEHRNCSTASFDVDRRLLTLPRWDKASSTVYDMLVGHEVGHALFTPNTDWKSLADCPMDFVNVIEDARIEKLMKRKYPGLRKSFVGGYRELNDQDFFGIFDEDLSKLSLIDRINLHFKIGASAMIPFSIEEQVFVARTDVAETFEEVCAIANDVYNFSADEKVAEQNTENLNEGEDGGEDMTLDEMLDEAQKRESSNEEPPTGGKQSSQQSDDDGDNDCEEAEVDEEDDEGAGENNNSVTQDNFDRASEKLSSRSYGTNSTYVEIPNDVKASDVVVDWSIVHDWIDDNRAERDDFYSVDHSYKEFRKQSQKEVNYLVKEFECRKSADAYARAGQSKTGVLDTSKLHTYKYSDDIFKKITVVPDGKNHGLLFVLDWSGSMGNEIFATVKQLLNLTAFCKKVQIPFEVYAFTNEWYAARRVIEKLDYCASTISENAYMKKRGLEKGKIHIDKVHFNLVNFISSRSNSREYERMCLNLYREAYTYKYYANYSSTMGLGLSGTPLNEAIICMNYIIPEFKKQNDLQKVNVCILTDGEACNSCYGVEKYNDYKDEYYTSFARLDSDVVLRDRETGHVYPNFAGIWSGDSNIFIKQLRDRNPGVNVIGFRILGGKDLSNFVFTYGNSEKLLEVQKQWKKEKSAIIPLPKSFTALFAIQNNSMEETVMFDVDSGAKKADISKAFKKMLVKKSSNKKILSSFVDYVC